RRRRVTATRNEAVVTRQPPSIRSEYEKHGVRGFYRDAGAGYRNPHEPQVRRCLAAAVARWKPDLSRVLDLAAGSGEATLALRELGGSRGGSWWGKRWSSGYGRGCIGGCPRSNDRSSCFVVIPTSAARRDLGRERRLTPARDPSGR